MKLLHVYPALAAVCDAPRITPESVSLCGLTFTVYREVNIYLDSKQIITRYAQDPRHAYCLEIQPGMLAVLTNAPSDEAFEAKLNQVAEFGERVGKRPIDGIQEWVTNLLKIAEDPQAYTVKMRAAVDQRRAEREAAEALRKQDRERRQQEETARRIASNTKAFHAGDYIHFDGFEELCGLHGITMPIRTIGACRKNVSEVSRCSIKVNKGSKPDAVWIAIRALGEAIAEESSIAVQNEQYRAQMDARDF